MEEKLDRIDFFGREISTNSLEEIMSNLILQWDEEEEGQHNFTGIQDALFATMIAKTVKYGPSWRKRGIADALSNLMRKVDRLEAFHKELADHGAVAFMQEVNSDESGDSFVDTLADTANYAVLLMTLVMHYCPNAREQWLENMLKFFRAQKKKI